MKLDKFIKITLLGLVIFFIILGLLFLVFSISNASISPSKWGSGAGVLFGVLGFIDIIASIILASLYVEENEF